MEKVAGTVGKIFYYNPETSWGSFLLKDLDSKKNIKCAGNVHELKANSRLTLYGDFKNTKYGRQLEINTYEKGISKREDATPATVIDLMKEGKIKGIGKPTAKKILDYFGKQSEDILKNDYTRLTEIVGIGSLKANSIHDSFVRFSNELNEPVKVMMGYGITENTAKKIYNKYGPKSISELEADPYILADREDGVANIGFTKADKIAFSMGFQAHDPIRIQAIILYLLACSADTDGSTYYTFSDLKKKGKRFLTRDANDRPDKITEDEIQDAIDTLENEKKIIIEDTRIYSRKNYFQEKYIASKLVALQWADTKECYLDIDEIEEKLSEGKESKIKYDEGQREAIETASMDDTGVMVLTGGPGTGKSTVTKGIITMLENSKYEILCAAPTGRAAKRMTEATGRPSTTIHRMLGFRGGDGLFVHNQNNPLECDAVIIDEASMIDNSLMYSLLKAISEGTKLILIGDTDQLPSVGAGNVLRDVIKSEIFPMTQLRTIHRQGKGSLIVDNAHAINRGDIIQTNNTEDTDCIFIDSDALGSEQESVVDKIVSLVKTEIPQKYGYDPKEIQVLIPMKKNILGTYNVNDRLQKELKTSADHVKAGDNIFYVGDKVMQVKNDISKRVYNGDIGEVSKINYATRKVIVKYPDYESSGDKKQFINVVYDFSELGALILAYATTIHKSQGSEYPAVIMIVSYSHYIMLQRNLIYTGLTRASNLCYIIGTEQAIKTATNTIPADTRKTTLKQRLFEELDKIPEENGDEYIENKELDNILSGCV